MVMKAYARLAVCGMVVGAVSLFGLEAASSALATTAWWHVGSGSRPHNLRPGSGSDEIQRLTVSATGGQNVLEDEETGGLALLSWDATPEEAQEALEGLYGAGNVDVSGGPGDETGSKPYTITFTGELAFRSVKLIKTHNFLLTGGRQEAMVSEAHGGRPDGQIVVTAANLGDANANGEASTVMISDKLPARLKAVGIEAVAGTPGPASPGPVACSLETLTCTFAHVLSPFHQIEVRIAVLVQPGATSSETNEATVTGGEAPGSSVNRPITVSDTPTPFGAEDYELRPEEEGGSPDTQAGSHPFQLTTTLTLNQTADAMPAQLPKDLRFKLPPGLIGNPAPIPSCTLGKFLHITGGQLNECPPRTAVGAAMVTINEPAASLAAGAYTFTVPVFNLEPDVGEPARFGFLLPGTPVFLDTSVRTGDDYGVTVSVSNVSQTAGLLSSEVTFWGIPGDTRHDSARGNGCLHVTGADQVPCTPLEEDEPPPFLALPTSCTGPLHTTIAMDSWVEPKPEYAALDEYQLDSLDGCNRLQFSPSIKVTPDGQAASSPTGLTVDVHVPEEGILNRAGLTDSNIKDVTVTLPEGVTLNPAAADGLQACSEALVGYLPGDSAPPTDLHFTPKLPEPIEPGLNFCPDASKVGTVTIKTPLLPNPLEGFVYLASPAPNQEEGANPFKALVAMYIIAKDRVSGALVKLPGKVILNQQTGQISATFENTPQLAFEDAELHFFGGDRAPLATPAHCGTYTTHATFTPWSGNEAVGSDSSFQVATGPGGAPCPGNPLPFAPSLASGTTNINAAAFSPLTTTISRDDGNQNIQSVQLYMPPGLSGILAGVKLCPEAQANAGTCSPESLIGHTIVSVGLGGDPFSVTGGKVFLTESYAGAPFGLSIVNPAVAGPFNLGKVVVRAKIEVDPHTAALTITTGTIPHILDGIPLQIKHVNVMIDRAGFTFNPTNCSPMAITGAIGSVEGASSPVSVPFQVTNCSALKFAPKFTVSTSGKTSKANGATLVAKLAEPAGALGTQANIKRVKVDLPKQLPSRLTTLQRACTSAQFNANPAGCPPASIIGHATVHTPLLPVPLTGPAYFVSHGGEAFPSLTLVLQGYGVTVDLVGTTFISKAGVTSTTFKTVPDTPFNTFELTLPQGKFSALAANGNLCASKLAMPTEFVAQNGAVIHQSTKIGVTGCARKKALTRAQKLAKAMKRCKRKPMAKRATCRAQARRKYSPVKKK
jgi:hypothetical protein